LRDTILIDKDFKIKLKSHDLTNQMIYSHLRKFLPIDKNPSNPIASSELDVLIKFIQFLDLRTNKTVELEAYLRGKPLILNLFISPCIECPENRRFSLLKDFAGKYPGAYNILVLFGKSNNPSIIGQLIKRFGLNIERIDIGIIKAIKDLPPEKYFELFRYDIDPRLSVLNSRGQIIFSEDPKNQRSISLTLLERMAK
jgi:hypothetical protein